MERGRAAWPRARAATQGSTCSCTSSQAMGHIAQCSLAHARSSSQSSRSRRVARAMLRLTHGFPLVCERARRLLRGWQLAELIEPEFFVQPAATERIVIGVERATVLSPSSCEHDIGGEAHETLVLVRLTELDEDPVAFCLQVKLPKVVLVGKHHAPAKGAHVAVRQLHGVDLCGRHTLRSEQSG